MIIALLALLVATLVLVAAMAPWRATVSTFELKRRIKRDAEVAQREYDRHMASGAVAGLLMSAQGLLLAGVAVMAMTGLGWVAGWCVTVVVIIFYRAIARQSLIRQVAQRLYFRWEPRIIWTAQKLPWLRSDMHHPQPAVASKEELLAIVGRLKKTLTPDERTRIAHALAFSDRTVGDVMIPREQVTTIAHDEVLGPLTLDMLHKTGDSYVPVVDTTLETAQGVLYVDDVLVVTRKKTPTAAEAMDARVFYVRDDQSLEEALGLFLQHHHHISIVRDSEDEVVGVLSVEDVIVTLLGYEILVSADTE